MTADKFVKSFYLERQSLIDTYFNTESKTDISELIKALNLDDKGNERLRQILSGSLRDTLYTILLGLDGEASIGDKQTMYKLFDEENNELTGGEIEVSAYEYFHNNVSLRELVHKPSPTFLEFSRSLDKSLQRVKALKLVESSVSKISL
jgi:hypothetical protein